MNRGRNSRERFVVPKTYTKPEGLLEYYSVFESGRSSPEILFFPFPVPVLVSLSVESHSCVYLSHPSCLLSQVVPYM